MAQWLVLIGLFSKTYGESIPVVAASIPVYLYFIIFCRQLWLRPIKIDQLVFNSKVTFWSFIVVLDQLIMIGYSYVKTIRPQDTRGIFNGSVNTVLFVANIFLIYYLLVVLLDSQDQILKFVQGTIKTFIGFAIFVLLPQVVATFSHFLDGWVNLIGKLFESRHVGRNDFYWLGSYATTQHRVNGFSNEASFLAVLLAIVFIPLFLAAIRYNFSFFENRVDLKTTKYYWLLLAISFFVLFFAKTTTGFIVILLAILILLVRLDVKRRKQLVLVALLMLAVLVVLYISVPYIQELLNHYLFKKQGTSNRLGGTIGLFLTFLHYPLTGVGEGFTSFYNFKFVPTNTIHNWEFQDIFLQTGYPVQSIWGGWLASFGLIGIVPIVIFIYHKSREALSLYKAIDLVDSDNFRLYQVLIESFFYSLFMLGILALFTFSWKDNINYVIFFFYIVTFKFAKKQVSSTAIS